MLFRDYGLSRIEIDLLRRELKLYQGSFLINTYPIAIGKPSTPSPIGQWQIINKKVITYPSVFGTRWMGLSNPGYGIHGTNNPASIGTAASLGCIRMYNRDVESLFPLVSIGAHVLIQHSSHQRPPADDNHPDANSTNTYTVLAGDNLWSIARRLNIPLIQLIKANPHLHPDNLQIGQKINLP